MQNTITNALPLTTRSVCNMPVLMTQKQVAGYLGVSEKWFERDRWVGASLPYIKFGRQVRYRAEDVAAYVEAHAVTAKQA